ncbi:unnamed protein product [marine sediment metagenome]|uniref:Helix-turn-helix domain-containing protein n=1 Tax=marine sediment metagenome TaxID=412755 RepID=X1LMJ5_9ZZZZ
MPVEYLNVADAADHAGVCRPTVYCWIDDGVFVDGVLLYLPVSVFSRVYHINIDELDHFLDLLGYEYEDESEPNDNNL